jgi:hypothetical protein
MYGDGMSGSLAAITALSEGRNHVELQAPQQEKRKWP